MATRHTRRGVPIVTIELETAPETWRSFAMRMDFNALELLESKFDLNALAIDFGTMTIKQIKALVWSCLQHEADPPTVQQVGAMLHPGNVEEVGRALYELARASFPDAQSVEPTTEDASPVPLGDRASRRRSTGRA